jgi:hypothetical protein
MFNAVHEEHIYWSSGMQPIFKKRDQLDYESVEMQLADCKAKIAMLQISNNDYKNTIDLLTAKLGIKEPMINRAEMYGNDHPQQSLFYKMGQIESLHFCRFIV